jgi:hypothetical protein
LAHEYPGEAELYADAVRAMEAGEGGAPAGLGAMEPTRGTPEDLPVTLAGSARHASRTAGGAHDASITGIFDDDDDEGSNALRNIRKFVKAEATTSDDEEGSSGSASAVAVAPLLGSVGAAEEEAGGQTTGLRKAAPEISGRYGSIYAGLIGRVRAKERLVAVFRSQCSSIARDAQVDVAALSRSAKRVDAKLRMAKATMSEYEQSSAYDLSQHKLIQQHLQKLDALSKESDSHNTNLRTELRRHAEQLMALATDLGQQLTADEQRSAHIVRDLVQKVENHYHGLYQRHQHFVKRRNAVTAVDERLLRLLAEDAAHNRRRMARLKSETQLLSSLAYAKGNDHALSRRYQEAVGQLCSKDRLQSYTAQAQELKKEESEIQHAATAGRSSTTSPIPATTPTPTSLAPTKATAEDAPADDVTASEDDQLVAADDTNN